MSKVKILYGNINSYKQKRYLINNTIENYQIDLALFVETKTKPEHNTSYRDWNMIKLNGNTTDNTRGGSLVLCQPKLRMGKENAPTINNPLNECIHFTIPFHNEKLHIFLTYIHPKSKIEETILTKALQYKYAIIIGDFNVKSMKEKENQIKEFLKSNPYKKIETDPTYMMVNHPDTTPDLILHTDNITKNFSKPELIPDLGSNHLSLLFTFDVEENPIEIVN